MDNEQIPFLESANLSCSDIEELMDCYIDGEMVSALVSKYEQHLEKCDSCREMISETRHILEVARELKDTPIPEAASSRLRDALFERVGHNVTPLRPRLTLVKS